MASTRKGRGEAMSREDLAGYFARAHSRPVHKPRAQPTSPDDYTVKFGARPSQVRTASCLQALCACAAHATLAQTLGQALAVECLPACCL